MCKEIWKRYKETKFEVSNLGNVRNWQNKKPRKFSKNPGGYLSVYDNQDKKSYRLHRMVAELFVDGFSEKLVVNHVDGNKTNNHFKNLEWVTSSENTIHAYETGLKSKGSSTKWATLDESAVVEIKEAILSGVPAQRLAEKYQVSPGTISNLKLGRAWKNVGPDLSGMKSKSSKRKLTAEDIPTIRQMIAAGKSDREIAELYDVARGTIYRIRSGQNWKNY
jgi:transposase